MRIQRRIGVTPLCSTMSTYIKRKQTYRRKRAREPLVDGDVESAEAVTNTRIAVPQDDGTVIYKHVLESLETPRSTGEPKPRDNPLFVDDPNYDQIHNMSPPPPSQTRTRRVSLLFDN